MADPQDRALGAVIRARRTARGLQQQELAERIGMAPVVYGRIELGNRPVKATELRDIARVLGVTTDDLLGAVSPVSPEQQVERAAARRDTAYTALREYGSAVLDAIAAVRTSESGAVLDDQQLEDSDDVAAYLRDSRPLFDGITAPVDLVMTLRQAIDDLAASVAVYTSKGETDG
ncbi:helix-turn-helix domain-containing protein [Mycobacteroides abscessus]|uniref:helix-turn-helix domain-containing protein n=1 Tax=Mycobacteroides abscessus TaxID=36809 RepID=UPI0007F96621|nr:helix-turn-helix transcriptional regulator [Mycobacteroides abscessus]ANO12798.1 hypothetical protein BAB77_02060 [Mycobacteroides abscessus]ARQ63050.1 transcriptional regulator [Mycobacteroides abscessus subsp. massiliense]MBE5447535.1 hypothetical protein [Mycobacteroides abscessus]MBE5514156.1 hypothetical protein [Mycobacteroides abscessus]MBN7511779.1 helix-turn-helix transcriptional regulator [Mycobacteroides abscessus subsp. massiliense]